MQKSALKFILLILISGVFTGLLFQQYIGINLIIYETAVAVSLILLYRKKPTRLCWIFGTGWLVSSAAVLLINTDLSIWMNFIGFILFCASWLWKEIRHPAILFWLFILNIYRAQHRQWKIFLGFRQSDKNGKKWFRGILAFISIAAILFLFILIYKTSSEYFNQNYKLINNAIARFLNFFIGEITFAKVLFFILGFTFTSALMLRNEIFRHLNRKNDVSEKLLRTRHPLKKPGLLQGLNRERNTLTVLLLCLNLLILFQNFLDIKNIWIHFEWNGGYLKQFVHEGTYLLIFSVIISAVLVLYIFRKNQNFFKRNIWLKRLTYVWLFQNLILTVSVGVRNYWYINYFNLAYLRVGVFIFLLLVIAGLILVYLKIVKKQSGFSIFGKGIIVSYIILTVSGSFNWDVIIVRYNLAHAGEAYFHHDFMVTMPDKTLWLMKEHEELFDVAVKTDSFHVYTKPFFGSVDTMETYRDLLKFRYEKFTNEFKKRSWKSWNLADAFAYKKLTGGNE